MISDSHLADLIDVLPYASFKDAGSGKYIWVNDDIAKRHRVTIDQMVGSTVEDVGFVPTLRSKGYAKQTQEMDRWVMLHRCKFEMERCVMLCDDDRLMYESVAKIPVVGDGNVLGIITCGQDLTAFLPDQELYVLYKNLYKRKELAIQALLKHLEVDAWFYKMPTEAELMVLLERGNGKTIKEIALDRRVAPGTIDTHLTNLRIKLKGDVLHKIVSILRTRRAIHVHEEPV
jgi:DNA-binding CsgD family transcriptional regulator